MKRLAAALLLVTAAARADDALRLTVAVGETATREVGYAQGAACDDPSIATAEMRAHTAESNTFAVTGVRAGTTLCRAGTMPTRPAYVFEVRVVAAKPKR